jgi:hypothetical protein
MQDDYEAYVIVNDNGTSCHSTATHYQFSHSLEMKHKDENRMY